MDTLHKELFTILSSARDALQKKDYNSLKLVSDKIVHNASIFQDNHTVNTAVVLYALAKVVQRCENWHVPINIELDKAIRAVQEEKHNVYEKELKHIIQLLKKSDKRVRKYAQEALERAKAKKGFKLHTHGLSIARTAKVLGVSQWEMQNYIGRTMVQEPNRKDRMVLTRKLFK